MVGQYRWLNRLWAMVDGLTKLERKESKQHGKDDTDEEAPVEDAEQNHDTGDVERNRDQERNEMLRAIHDAIAHVTADLEGPNFTFNTAVAQLMGLSNRVKPTHDVHDHRTMVW